MMEMRLKNYLFLARDNVLRDALKNKERDYEQEIRLQPIKGKVKWDQLSCYQIRWDET